LLKNKNQNDRIKKELENIEGVEENIDIKKEEIDDRLKSFAEDNPEVNKIISIIEELNKKCFIK
jgi:hypothetical protein